MTKATRFSIVGSDLPKAEEGTAAQRLLSSLKVGDRLGVHQTHSLLPIIECVTGVFPDVAALEASGVVQQLGMNTKGRVGPFVMMPSGFIFDRDGRAMPALALEAQGIPMNELVPFEILPEMDVFLHRRKMLVSLDSFHWGLIPHEARIAVLRVYGFDLGYLEKLTPIGALTLLENREEFHPGTLENEDLEKIERILQKNFGYDRP